MMTAEKLHKNKQRPFRTEQKKRKLNEQVSANKTVDKALWRKRELMNECKLKLNEGDILTRKERKALI